MKAILAAASLAALILTLVLLVAYRAQHPQHDVLLMAWAGFSGVASLLLAACAVAWPERRR